MEKIVVPTEADAGADLPTYSTHEAAGADVYAHIEEDLIVEPSETVLVPTGLRFAIPAGFEIQVRPRSGLSLKYGISVLNTPGTIDSDYRGEVKVILINHGKEIFVIKPKMRIAQLVIAPVFQAEFMKEEALETTARGSGGFGHTGV